MIDEWTIPSCAFVTFETDDAKEIALDLASSFGKEMDTP